MGGSPDMVGARIAVARLLVEGTMRLELQDRRSRRIAAAIFLAVTLPALAFVLVRTYAAPLPSELASIATDEVIAVEGDADQEAALPPRLERLLAELDAGDPENPFVQRRGGAPTFSSRLDDEGFRWPVGGPDRITSPFGPRGNGFHHGVDIACAMGTPIGAVGAGTVVWTGAAPVYGNLVVIHHGGGRITLYAHLSRIIVREGDPVTPGATIGLCGSTGFSTGPHLHLELRSAGRAWDPVPLLP